jgi:hypothetical protein
MCDTTFAAVAGCCCHKPFDLIFVEWFFESQQYVRNLLRICFMIHLLVRSFEENRAWQFCRGVHGYVLGVAKARRGCSLIHNFRVAVTRP